MYLIATNFDIRSKVQHITEYHIPLKKLEVKFRTEMYIFTRFTGTFLKFNNVGS